jgi:photosystem II stability/assembly factor-like uncharacterized protein
MTTNDGGGPNNGDMETQRMFMAQQSGLVDALNSVWGTGSNVFAVGDSGTILYTSDGGKTWTRQSSGVAERLEAVWGTGSGDIYVGGTNQTILHTFDLGKTWTKLSTGTSGPGSITGFAGGGRGDVYAVGGQGGKFLFSSSDGATWTQRDTGLQVYLNAVWADPAEFDSVLMVGFNDFGAAPIVAASLQGRNISTAMSGTNSGLEAVWGSSSSDIYAAGSMGTLLHGSMGAWAPQASGTTNYLSGLWGSSSQDVYVVGDGGFIGHTTGGGAPWTTMPSGTKANLHGIWGSSSTNIYVVGDGGTILHYP